jgi:hypothetical protein
MEQVKALLRALVQQTTVQQQHPGDVLQQQHP